MIILKESVRIKNEENIQKTIRPYRNKSIALVLTPNNGEAVINRNEIVSDELKDFEKWLKLQGLIRIPLEPVKEKFVEEIVIEPEAEKEIKVEEVVEEPIIKSDIEEKETKQFKISTRKYGKGTGSFNIESKLYDEGTILNLVATPEDGSVVRGEDKFEIVVTKNQMINVTFDKE